MQGMQLHPCSCMPLPVQAVQMRLPRRLAPAACLTRPLQQQSLRLIQSLRSKEQQM